MPKVRSQVEEKAGKLILAIQKEWGRESEEECIEESEQKMGLAHDLLQARTKEGVKGVLSGQSVTEFIGAEWVARHPSVASSIQELEKALS